MNLAEIPTWLAFVSTAALSLMVFWRRPPAQLWPSLFFVSFAAMLWCLGEALSSFATSREHWHWRALVVEYSGVLSLPATWWLFGLRFAELQGHRLEWAGRGVRYGPLALSGLFWLGMVSNPWHGQFITPHIGARSEFHSIWYAQAIMSYLLMLGIIGLFVWMRSQARDSVLRGQLGIMLAASLVPLVCNALYITGLVDPGFGITAAGLGVSMILFFTGIYRDRLFTLSSISMHHLIEHETDGMLVMDRHGRLLHFNPAAERLLQEERLFPDIELFPLLERHLRDPEHREPLSAHQLSKELMGEGQPPGVRTYWCEGERGCWLDTEVVPIPDRSGRRLGSGLRLRDVTALRETREKLDAQAVVLEAILDSAEQGMLVVDGKGGMIYSNRAFQQMWSIPDDVMSSGDEELALPHALRQVDDPEAFLAEIRHLYEEPLAESREEVRLLDGRVFERSSRTLMKEGEVAGRVWSFFDVTEERDAERERRHLERHMQQAQKMEGLGLLAGGIAHDFNNLLVGIVGNADLALLSVPEESPLRGPLRDILESSQRAAELTNQMLAYSGRSRFVVGAIDLPELVEETQHLLEAVISKNATVKLELERVPAIEGDATQLRQVVMNLITNASDALDGALGTVRVVTRVVEADAGMLAGYHFGESLDEGSYVLLEVSDSGVGMDEETALRIFDPFFTTKFTGRGLGLAAVLGIVRAHDGAIRVDSKVGRGTRFQLLIPAASERPAQAVHVAAAGADAWSGSGTILVADDEPGVLRLMKRALERAGFTVVTAEDGRKALACYSEHVDEIVAVILDMTMPDLGGGETFTALREQGAEVPILLSSGYSESETRSSFDGAGPSAFLQKPFTATEMLYLLRQVLDTEE